MAGPGLRTEFTHIIFNRAFFRRDQECIFPSYASYFHYYVELLAREQSRPVSFRSNIEGNRGLEMTEQNNTKAISQHEV